MRSLARGARTATVEVALTLGAILGVVCLLAAVAAVGLGVKPLLFRSGSMEPAIGTGALALARTVPAADVAVGDVVSVTDPAGTRITHRVVAVEPISGDPDARSLVLQGDANTIVDAQPYVVDTVDRVGWHVERLGYAVAWLSSPAASFVGGTLAVGLLLVAFRRRKGGGDEPPAPVPTGGRRRADVPVDSGRVSLGAAAVTLLVATSCVVGLGSTRPTLAAFTSSATATATFSALTVAAPTSLTCTATGDGLFGGPRQFNLVGRPVTAGYSYILRVTNGASTVDVAATVSGTTVTATVPVSSLTTLLGIGPTTVQARLYARLASTPSWESAASPTASLTVNTITGLIVIGHSCTPAA